MKIKLINNFTTLNDIVVNFQIDGEALLNFLNATSVFASYGEDNYSGDAFVLFKVGEDWFEVNGSHCSCNGLEDQWEPEATKLASLFVRLEDKNFGVNDWSGNEFRKELIEFLKDEL